MVQRTGLFRSRTNKVLGGVAGGIAYNLNTDVTLIRVLFLILAIFWGGGVLVYLILWIALPEENIPMFTPPTGEGNPGDNPEAGVQADYPPEAYEQRTNTNVTLVLGIIFIALGAVFLTERIVPYIHFRQLWPIVLVVAGLVLIISNFTGSKKQ